MQGSQKAFLGAAGLVFGLVGLACTPEAEDGPAVIETSPSHPALRLRRPSASVPAQKVSPPAVVAAPLVAGRPAPEIFPTPEPDTTAPDADADRWSFIEHLKRWEGLRRVAYQCSAHECTIGHGFNLNANEKLARQVLAPELRQNPHFIRDLRAKKIALNDDQIHRLLMASINAAEVEVARRLKKSGMTLDSLPPSQRYALTSLVFNAPSQMDAKLIGYIKSGNLLAAACEITLNCNPHNFSGVWARRLDEAVMFLGRLPTLAELRAHQGGRNLTPLQMKHYQQFKVRSTANKNTKINISSAFLPRDAVAAENHAAAASSYCLADYAPIAASSRADAVLAKIGSLVAGRVNTRAA